MEIFPSTVLLGIPVSSVPSTVGRTDATKGGLSFLMVTCHMVEEKQHNGKIHSGHENQGWNSLYVLLLICLSGADQKEGQPPATTWWKLTCVSQHPT